MEVAEPLEAMIIHGMDVMIYRMDVMITMVPDDGEEVAEDEELEAVTDEAMEAGFLAAHLAVLLAVHLEVLMAPELQPADGGIRSPLSSSGSSTIRWRYPATTRTLEALEANHGGSG